MIIKFNHRDIGDAFQKLFDFCNEPEGKYILEINKSKNIRSLNQNKFYWSVVLTVLSDYFGYTPEEVHQICASMFLRYENNGKEFTKSTTKLSTIEFENYIESIRIWAHTDHGVHVPIPNEVTEEMYIDLHRKHFH